MAGPEYLDYLCAQIKEIQEFAGQDQVAISLSCNDGDKLSVLTEKTGAELTVSAGSNFIGGIRAAIPEKNIMIDNSFLRLLLMRKEFKFDGGLKHA